MEQSQGARMQLRVYLRPALVYIKAVGWIGSVGLRVAPFAIGVQLAIRDHDVILALLIGILGAGSFWDRLYDYSGGFWHGLHSGLNYNPHAQERKS